MKTHIKFNIKTIRHIDSGLSLAITANDQEIFAQQQVLEPNLTVEAVVELPATFDFFIQGKQPGDTVMSPGGLVEADKAFVLESLELDGFVVESWKLPPTQIFLQCQDGTKFPGTYWAFNGHAQVIIDRDDPVLWILDHPSILEMPENG